MCVVAAIVIAKGGEVCYTIIKVNSETIAQRELQVTLSESAERGQGCLTMFDGTETVDEYVCS